MLLEPSETLSQGLILNNTYKSIQGILNVTVRIFFVYLKDHNPFSNSQDKHSEIVKIFNITESYENQ